METLDEVYRRLVDAGIRYAYEDPISIGPWQAIRSPTQVLRSPGLGTCLDVGLVMAAASLTAGLSVTVCVLESATGDSRHAVLIIDLDPGPEPVDRSGVWADLPALVRTDLVDDIAGPPRRFCAIDPVQCTIGPDGSRRPSSFAEAVASGADQLTASRWRWRTGIDLRVLWQPSNVLMPESSMTTAPNRAEATAQWQYIGGQGWTHFQRAARGQRVLDLEDDLFRGRDAVLNTALAHVLESRGAQRPLLLVGAPGTGKSCALARVVMRLTETDVAGLAFHAHESTFTDVIRALATVFASDANEGDILRSVASSQLQRVVLAVDAFDEMRTDHDRNSTAALLRELSAYPAVRVVVATRTAGDGGVLDGGRTSVAARLHGGGLHNGLVVRLDSPTYFDSEEFVLLIEQALSRPPVFADDTASAWQEYRGDAALRRALAVVIAQRAGTNYFVGTQTSARLAGERSAVDPRAPGFSPASLPDGVDELFDSTVDRLKTVDRSRALGLLSALAYGRGSGLSDERWLRFAHALGVDDVAFADIEELRRSVLADFITDTTKGGLRLTRLFHQSLVDLVKSRRNQLEDERKLCESLTSMWLAGDEPDPYAVRFLPSHVLSADAADQFMALPEFLLHCDPSAVGPVARELLIRSHSPESAAYLLAAPFLSADRGRNGQALFIAARMQGQRELARGLFDAADWGRWAFVAAVSRPSRAAIGAFLGHEAGATALARWPRDACDSDFVVSCSLDGTARVWNPFEPGSPEVARYEGHTGPVRAVTTVTWPGLDTPAVVTTGDDGTARIWNPHHPDGDDLARYEGHTGPVRAVTTVTWPGLDTPAVVTTGDDGTARIWNPHHPDGDDLAEFHDHRDWVGGVVADPGTDSSRQLVTTSGDGLAMARSMTAGLQEGARYAEHRGRVRAITVVDWESDGLTVLTSSDDGTAHLWSTDGFECTPLEVFDGPAAGVTASVQVFGDGTSVFVSACSDGVVYVWHPSAWDHAESSGPSKLHTGRVRSSAVLADPEGESIRLVTGSSDATARVWTVSDDDVRCSLEFGEHRDWVRDLATLDWPGVDHPAVVSASGDGTVMIWDPERPGRVYGRYSSHRDVVRTVRVVESEALLLPHLISASADRTVRIWNPYAQPAEDVAVLDHDDIVRCAIPVAHESLLQVAAACRNELVLWSVASDGGTVNDSLALGRLELRDLAVVHGEPQRIAGVGNDGIVYIVDPAEDLRIVAEGHGHRDWIWQVAVLPSRDIVTASADGTMRTWRLRDDELAEIDRITLVSAGLSVRTHGSLAVITTAKGFMLLREATG